MGYSIKAKFYHCEKLCYFDSNNNDKWLEESKNDGTNISLFEDKKELYHAISNFLDDDFQYIWIEKNGDLQLVYNSNFLIRVEKFM